MTKSESKGIYDVTKDLSLHRFFLTLCSLKRTEKVKEKRKGFHKILSSTIDLNIDNIHFVLSSKSAN